jgi:hypothetical protein
MTARDTIDEESDSLLFPEVIIKDSPSTAFQNKLNDLIDHLNAVVSIGTSNDEEEIIIVTHPSDVCCENRNDNECISEDGRGDTAAAAAAAVMERDDKVDDLYRFEHGSSGPENSSLPMYKSSAADEKESAEIITAEAKNIDAGDGRVEFGSHKIRDSVLTGDDAGVSEIVTETTVGCLNQEPICNRFDKEESVNHLLGLVPGDNESICTSISDTNIKTEEQLPLKSILKKTNDRPITTTTSSSHPLLSKFQKRTKFLPILVSPKELKSIPTFNRIKQQRSTVTFSTIQLRTYDIILGDHPNCKFGAPLSLSWIYHQHHDMSIDNYEKCRHGQRRKMKRLYLNSRCRRNLLRRAGFTVEEISEAINNVQLVQLLRQESAEDYYNDAPPFTLGMATAASSLRDLNMEGWNSNKSKTPQLMVRLRHMVLSIGNLKRRSNF